MIKNSFSQAPYEPFKAAFTPLLVNLNFTHAVSEQTVRMLALPLLTVAMMQGKRR